MTRMLMEGEDCRTKTVCDPAVGTGRFLLTASNYSLRLYGQDIDPTVCMATLVNGYLLAPWLVRPLPFLDADNLDPAQSAAISDSIAAQAPPHIAEQMEKTEYDTEEAFRFEPIKKRRRTKEAETRQGSLF
jgi:tRNA G10  N-methylase Trm11